MDRIREGEHLEPAAVRQRTENGAVSATHRLSTSGNGAAGIREELASIGEEIKGLQGRLSRSCGVAGDAPPSDSVTETLWTLLWRLRTFLYLAAPSAARQWKIGGAVFAAHHRGHYGKDAAHVAVALRLYLVLLRFTVVCPAAALHGCLTLLGVLVALIDPRLRSWRDSSDRLLEGLLFVARALQSSDSAVFTLFVDVLFELLAEVTMHFHGSAASVEVVATSVEMHGDTDASDGDSALYLRLSAPAPAALRLQTEPLVNSIVASAEDPSAVDKSQLQQDIFSTCTCVETLYEARCIQACVLRLVVLLGEERLPRCLSPDRVALVCDVACHLVSSAVPGVDGGVVNQVQHDAAWNALHHLAAVDCRLLPHVEGPLVLSLLASKWSQRGAHTCSSVYEVTTAEQALFGWCHRLSTTELDSLVLAMHRRGGAGVDGQGAVLVCLAQMWEVAVQWCAQLYTTSSSSPSTDADAAGSEAGRDGGDRDVSRMVAAMADLHRWVCLCERVFNSAAVQTCAFAARRAMTRQELQAARLHYLQLLANELPLAHVTASLLCTQLPWHAVDAQLAFLPCRVLSFFDLPVLAATVRQVVERAKRCIGVSAHRLLEANALAVLVRLHSCVTVSSCDADAFQTALTETLLVMRHHESPAYGLLVQSMTVLVHAFPHHATTGRGLCKPDVVTRAMQEFDAAVGARHHGSYVALDIPAPRWQLLERETAVALFAAGCGLGWGRRLLTLPTNTTTSAKAASVFLRRAAGLAEALERTLARAMAQETTPPSAEESPLCPSAGARGAAAASTTATQLQRAYDAMASSFTVAVPLLQAVGAVVVLVQQDTLWRRCATGEEEDGVVGGVKDLLRRTAAVLLRLLDAKYRFSRLAAPGTAAAVSDAASVSASRNGALRSREAAPPPPTTAVVVDVDVDVDGDHDETAAGRRGRRHAVSAAAKTTAAAVTPPHGGGDTGRAPTGTQERASQTSQLEKAVDVNRSHLQPALLAAARELRREAKTATDSRREADGADKEEGGAAESRTGDPRVSRVRVLQQAMRQVGAASLALSPPLEMAGDGDGLFDLSSASAADHVAGCALREVMLWSGSLDAATHEMDGGAATTVATTALPPPLLLLRLLGAERLRTTVFAAQRDGDVASISAAVTKVVELLWCGRRFFQRRRRLRGAARDAAAAHEAAEWLSSDSAALQEGCMAASERVAHEARAWLCLCFDLYQVYSGVHSSDSDAAVAVMGLSLETTRDVMAMFAWSATDLLRFRERPFVFSSFLKAVVDKEERDVKVVVTASLDVLGRYIISAAAAEPCSMANGEATSSIVPGSDATRARLRHLMEKRGVEGWRVVAGALAYVLYECHGTPTATQIRYLAEVMSYAKKSVKDVPAVVRSTIHLIAFYLLSLEADAQALARDRRRRSGRAARRRASSSSSPSSLSTVAAAGDAAAESVVGGAANRLFCCQAAAAAGASGAEEDAWDAGRGAPSHREGATAASETEMDALLDEDVLDSIAFSVFERALQQLVTLGEAAETTAGVETALLKPVSRAVAAEELRKNMFAVLDTVYKAIRIEGKASHGEDGPAGEGDPYEAPAGSLRTRRRWLLGLASFLRVMGSQTTPIALMLPTLLDRCATFPGLLPAVCVVWKELVCACTDEYLAESAASMVLSLVSLEQQSALSRESRAQLLRALQHLYTRTQTAEFWDSYTAVLGTFSDLVRVVLRSRRAGKSGAGEDEEVPQEGRRDGARVLLHGFVSVTRSGSLQSSTVFVRALYQYLSAADAATRHELSGAAAERPEVLQTLLRCSEADAESALYAMRCISILGAVAASVSAGQTRRQAIPVAAAVATVATVATAATATEAQRASMTLSPSMGADAWGRLSQTQSCYLDAETVLSWRKFSFTLLREYFPRVFASTADPVMHNCIAFAVQELLRATTRQERLQYKGAELRRDDVVHLDELERYIWWTRLTPHVKQLLGGFTTTRYSLTVNWQTRLRSPEYAPSLDYRKWLFAFFHHLGTLCEGWFAEMVQPLRNMAKKNASLILHLLPYMVVHVIESGKVEDVHYVEQEMKAVLEAAASATGSGVPATSLRSQSVYEVDPTHGPAEEPREHAHTILSVLEDVEQLRWTLLRHRGRVVCVFEPQEQTENLCMRLVEMYGNFLGSIPWSLRCRAALRVGSHIRALRSVECQRRLPALTSVIAAVPLQRIFAALNDRESARAIHRASPGLTPEDTAFSFENNGDWLAALASSELVLQHRPHSAQHQLTALHCMNELGELYMTSRYAASLLASTPAPAAEQPETTAAALRGASTLTELPSPSTGVAGVTNTAQLRHDVQAYANEAAWRLGQWDALWPSSGSAAAPGVRSVSLAMPAVHLQRALSGTSSLAGVHRVTDAERAKVVPIVRTPCHEDLTTRGYTSTVLLLHALGDVDAVSELCAAAFVASDGAVLDGSQASAPMMKLAATLLPSSVKEEVADCLTRRASFAEDTIAAREPLLSLHRLIYRELGMPQRVAETWLKQSELLRNGGLGEAALTAARQAAFECPGHVAETGYYVLVATLLHDTQSPTPAMEFVRECLGDKRIPARTQARLQILLTNWLIETGSERPERIFAEYDKARKLDSRSEQVHHQMALFCDHLHTLAINASEGAAAQLTAAVASPSSSSTSGGGGGGGSSAVSASAVYNAALQHQRETVESIQKYATRAIEHFAEALVRGVETASVSLPRMLTLWLDSAAFLGGLRSTTAGKLDGTAAAVLEEMNTRVRDCVLSTTRPVIPPAVVMTALPQLLSRLSHPVAAVRTVLTDVVLHLLSHFPQQCLWLVLPMALSKEGPREVVETQIIKPFADTPANGPVLRHAKIICDTLLTICNCAANLFPKEKGLTQLSPVQKITPMLPAAHFIVPVLSNLTPNISASAVRDVFPGGPCFARFDDRVVVMRSLQKPKRIWVHTDDGGEMSFLCKAKDEPRKDIRMMEVAALMNSFFLSDPEARRKRFSLRRYSITALSDDCAVIEWINDTAPLAKVAMECYALDRSGVQIAAVKRWVALVEEKKLTKQELFTKYILPEAPPVMHQWLDRTFPSNQSWYDARTLFTQSAALWSIAGHIVGLGDRHAENLMLDVERGELMHVDFACMFDKGEKLEVPERVRFRLTQNLTDVMGVLGANGPFQATCEVALRCEMRNKSAVMSIVETLLHEPLVEWRRQSSRSQASSGPKQLMERVARRLDGFLDLYAVPAQRDTLALNVESQVSKLIHHASDLENLSQMYIWWMAWI
ncbi:phosphatidylinositol 3-related kinase [Novymonas esmeraldas]|uniref:Serine/threonine-protein kinase ATR n=1 Tax=Novymonas esmeraldas TaxID=1808958 RepID=A0AAW0F3H9_9TRYP